MPALIRASRPLDDTRQLFILLHRVDAEDAEKYGEEEGRLLMARGECDIDTGENEKSKFDVLAWNADELDGWKLMIEFLKDHDLEAWDFQLTPEVQAIVEKGSKPGAHGWTTLQG